MPIAKGFIQATVVLFWAVYVAVQIVTKAGVRDATAVDPTTGPGLVRDYLQTLPLDALVVPTAAMVGTVVAVELVFAVARRHQTSRW
jgi:hypothetical protein